MRKRNELTEEEYFKIKRGNLKKIAVTDTFLFVAGICYIWYMLFANGGALRGSEVVWWGTALILFMILSKMFSVLPEILFRGRIGRQFYPKWVAYCCERLPQRLKERIERDCAEQPDLPPEEALLRLAKKRKKVSTVFDLAAAICLIRLFFIVAGLYSEGDIGYIIDAVLHNKPLIYKNINATPYLIVFLISLLFLIVSLICAVIYRIRSHAEEVGKEGKENTALVQNERDTERADQFMERLRKVCLISFGIFLAMYIGTLLVFFISLTLHSPTYEIVLTNENAEGFSYSEDHKFRLEFPWDQHIAGSEFYFLANGDYVNHENSLAQTANFGFEQLLDGERAGGFSSVLETYVKKEDDHHNVYMRMATNAEPIIYNETTYERDYPSIITPTQFLGYLSSEDLVGTAELDGAACELYKTTVNTPAMKNNLRYEVDRYMNMSSDSSYYYDYGLSDGLTIPLHQWKPMEREQSESATAGAEICVWIESDTKLVRRVELDATAFGRQYMEELFEENASRFTVHYLGIVYEYRDYGIKDITVPEELIAVSAQTAD